MIFWSSLKERKIRRIIIIVSVLFFSFQLIYLFSGSAKRLDSVPIGIETIILLFYIIYFFYGFSKNSGTTYIYNHYGFWISVGILIYLGGSFFFFILIDHLSKGQVESFGNLTYLAEVIKNILFTIAIFFFAKHPLKANDEKPKSIPFLDMN